MTSPSVPDDCPGRSERARSLRSKPSSVIASATRAAVAGATAASPLITRETVFRLTPAVRATSRIVGRGAPLVRNLAPLHHQLQVAEPAAPSVVGLGVADAHVQRPAAPAQVVELQRALLEVVEVVLLGRLL